MASISWDESVPSDTESLSLGDDRIRSLKTSLRQGLSAEHTWPSAGGDAGIHLLGSARAYVGTQSTVSSSGTDGRLQWASDSSQFFHVGSAGTSFIGGGAVISAGSYPGTLPQRAQWVEEFGLARIPSPSTTTAITIPNSGYSGVPYVFITGNELSGMNNLDIAGVTNLTPTTFTIYGTGSSGYTIAWRSIGTRAL